MEMGGSGGFGVFVDAQLGMSKGKAASLLCFLLSDICSRPFGWRNCADVNTGKSK